MTKKKTKTTKRHKRIRVSCFLCGGKHSTSQHSQHGKGAFKKTHKKTRKSSRRKKRR